MPILSVFNELIAHEETGGDMVERINKLNLHQVFEPIITLYGHAGEDFNQVLFYILHVYSKESKFIINGQSYAESKQRIIERIGMKKELAAACLNLEEKDITNTVRRYLRLQMSKSLEHLAMKRELYQVMVSSAMQNIVDKDQVIDYDQKFKNSTYADKLYLEIHEWEQRLTEENSELKEQLDEQRTLRSKSQKAGSLRIEDMLKNEEE